MRRGRTPASLTPAEASDTLAPDEITYASYLRLDQLLTAQAPEAERRGLEAHDEMLFIVVHQTYELWFKQILHELDRIQADFAQTPVDDWRLSRMVHALQRIHQILRLAVAQIDVMETMTPQDFLDFRDLLATSSGFQSLQFRLIETRLGLSASRRLLFGGATVDAHLSAPERAALNASANAPSVRDQLEAWLSRTPFVAGEAYAFRQAYRDAVVAMLEGARAKADRAKDTDEAEALAAATRAYAAIFEPDAAGDWDMAGTAVEAALFITVYRDRPALHMPHALLSALMDIDEAMALWRHRHALMVERMIGLRSGTGGSSGQAYLAKAAREHRVFTDLFRLSTYLIPRAALPPLPETIERRMAFVYASEGVECERVE